jgi:ketosteroid isomerase-like protein
MKKTAMLLFAFGILTGCIRSPVVDIRTETEAINKIEDQWAAAIKAKDNDKNLSFFAPNAVMMNANIPACVGLQAIRKSQELWFSDTATFHDTFASAVDTIEVSASGDMAYVRGTYRVSTGTRENPVEDVGKWVTIYRKIEGEWKAIVDIGNSDLPLINK